MRILHSLKLREGVKVSIRSLPLLNPDKNVSKCRAGQTANGQRSRKEEKQGSRGLGICVFCCFVLFFTVCCDRREREPRSLGLKSGPSSESPLLRYSTVSG